MRIIRTVIGYFTYFTVAPMNMERARYRYQGLVRQQAEKLLHIIGHSLADARCAGGRSRLAPDGHQSISAVSQLLRLWVHQLVQIIIDHEHWAAGQRSPNEEKASTGMRRAGQAEQRADQEHGADDGRTKLDPADA